MKMGRAIEPWGMICGVGCLVHRIVALAYDGRSVYSCRCSFPANAGATEGRVMHLEVHYICISLDIEKPLEIYLQLRYLIKENTTP